MILFTMVLNEMECITFVFVCNYQLIKDIEEIVKDLLYGLVPFQFFSCVRRLDIILKKKKKRRIPTLTKE